MLFQGYFRIEEGKTKGLELAVEECKHQFFWDLWNCPVTPNNILSKSASSRGKDMTGQEITYFEFCLYYWRLKLIYKILPKFSRT